MSAMGMVRGVDVLRKKRYLLKLILITVIILSFPLTAYGAPEDEDSGSIPNIGITIDGADEPEEVASTVRVILLLTVLSLAPSILIMMTCFTRIIIVLSFTRSAMGTQQMPPNQVLIRLALFLTFFIMSPVISDINTTAYQPLINGEITEEQAFERGMEPIREFMLKQTYKKDMNLFLSLSNDSRPENPEDIPNTALISAFITSEIKRGFQMGFFIYIPFIMIDMIVASTLMSMGMMMLPPVMISLPFKVLLFILVDGWNLVIKTLITSFN